MENKSRRDFLKENVGGVLAAAFFLGDFQTAEAADDLTLVPIPSNLKRIWLGENFWANRLEDWRLMDGRIECVKNLPQDALRTVSILTREIAVGNSQGAIQAKISLVEDAGAGGFGGFLIGSGGGRLDYRAAALVQGFSGMGGGLLAVVTADGHLQFREHTDEAKPTTYAELAGEVIGGLPTKLPSKFSEIVLRLDAKPQTAGAFDLTLTAFGESGKALAAIRRHNVAEAEILGGVMLVSSANPSAKGEATNVTAVSNVVGSGNDDKAAGARFAFADIRTGGAKIAVRNEQKMSAILGVLYSVNGRVLKMSAQFLPIGDAESGAARFEFRPVGKGEAAWRRGQTVEIFRHGYTALFRQDNWDSSKDWEYRVVYESAATKASLGGIVRRDPREKPVLTLGLLGCVMPSYYRFDAGIIRKEMPQAEFLGRFTQENIYFPHTDLVKNAAAHSPDILVFSGDQIYETSPTRIENRIKPTLDYLYKWYLWVWAFRDLTRSRPTILLTDDHDVYHPNVWGNGGRHAPDNDWNRGGYLPDADWVNMIQRTQCGHNPDAFDPTPADQGITVHYGGFEYGGVSFAVLEDRKWKTAPIQGSDLDVHEPQLLGERQETFLAEWAKDRSKPKIVLTQTLWGCLQTSPNGRALIDFDSNGYPKAKRDLAVKLVRDARALMLSGDQHLTSIVRHGVDAHADGPVQFTGPSGGVFWQRWFEPAENLANATGEQPSVTGDFTDAFGNKLRVLAVANPKFSFAEYRKYNKGRGQGFGDRKLKCEGYGIVRVDKRNREFVLESWPWNTNPKSAGALPFAGFPFRVKFDNV